MYNTVYKLAVSKWSISRKAINLSLHANRALQAEAPPDVAVGSVDPSSVWQLGSSSYPLARPLLSAYRQMFVLQGVRSMFQVARATSPLSKAMLDADSSKRPQVPQFDTADFMARMPQEQRVTCLELFGPGLCREKDAAILQKVARMHLTNLENQ